MLIFLLSLLLKEEVSEAIPSGKVAIPLCINKAGQGCRNND
jgi:hypothetical protein